MPLAVWNERREPGGATRGPGLDAALKQVLAVGAKQVSKPGIVTMRSGTREVMVRDPDTGVFLELFAEAPAK